MSKDAFDPTATPEDDDSENISSYVAKLVEAKGEKWKDPEVIAKGKYESDKFIEDLKRQNEELRKEIKREEELAELIATLKAQNKAPEDKEGRDVHKEESPPTAHSQSPDDMKSLVEQMLRERESETARKRNVEEVNSKLYERFGPSANSVVAKAAKDLDMTIDEAKELAATKPKAFFRLMGLDQDNRRDAGLVGNSRNSAATATSGNTRNNAYYRNLKKEIGSKYWEPKIQRQMAEDRKALGAAFWET